MEADPRELPVSHPSPSSGIAPLFPGPEGGVPEGYESDVVLKNGSTLHLRPVRPDDAPHLMAFMQGLSPESLYLRFMGMPHLDLSSVPHWLQQSHLCPPLSCRRPASHGGGQRRR